MLPNQLNLNERIIIKLRGSRESLLENQLTSLPPIAGTRIVGIITLVPSIRM